MQLPTSITDAVVAVVKQRAMTFPPHTQYCEKACELTVEFLTLVTCKKVTIKFLDIIPSENWFVFSDIFLFYRLLYIYTIYYIYYYFI